MGVAFVGEDLKPIAVELAEATRDVAPPGGALSMVQTHLAEICSVAASVSVSDYESADPAAVEGVISRSGALLTSALEALDAVAVLYGNEELWEPSSLPSSPPDDASAESVSRVDCEGIGETVVLARLGLRARQRALQSVGRRATHMERLAVVGSALRTIQKSLSAVDRAMANAERVPESINFYGRAVQRSLAIRRAYVHLHSTVAQDAAPKREDLRARVRLIGNSIASLLGKSIASHLRTEDRALLMIAHGKIRDYLTTQGEDAQHLAAGLRLWQDMVNLTTMFLDVNKREELVQHDARLVRDGLRHLSAGVVWSETARAATLERMAPMRGRSPALDTLLDAAPQAGDLETLRQLLDELSRTLGPACGGTDDAAPSSGRRPLLR